MEFRGCGKEVDMTVYCLSRWDDFQEILRHKKAFKDVRNSNEALKKHVSWPRAQMHDSLKALNVLLMGDKLATKLHRKFAGHHRGTKMNEKQKWEALTDWECARYTKPSKPLDGEETWKKYYKDVDMKAIIDEFKKAKSAAEQEKLAKKYHLK